MDRHQRKIVDEIVGNPSQNFVVLGPAGSGKSFVLRNLRATMVDLLCPGSRRRSGDDADDDACDEGKASPVLVVAPTGLSAINVGGRTIHSGLRLPFPGTSLETYVQEQRRKRYGPRSAFDYTADFVRKLHTVIVEEVSMVSAELLELVDQFLRVYSGHELPFGGVRIVAFGDVLQLPPVNRDGEPVYFFQSPLFQPGGPAAWNFAVRVLRSVHRQKHDRAFLQLLMRASQGLCTPEDERLLASRVVLDDSQIPATAVRIFCSNAEVDQYNQKCMAELDGDQDALEVKASTKAVHRTVQGKYVRSSFRRKDRKERFVKACDQALQKHLGKTWMQPTFAVKKGARVMLRINENVDIGLVNGQCGKVLTLAQGKGVRVQWDNELTTTVTPFTRYLALKGEFAGHYVAFTQFPLTLAWAMTIHKAQGMTLFSGVVVNPERAHSAGQLYVAFGRAPSLQLLHLSKPPNRDAIRADERVLAFLNAHGYFAALAEGGSSSPTRKKRPRDVDASDESGSNKKKKKKKSSTLPPAKKRKKKKAVPLFI